MTVIGRIDCPDGRWYAHPNGDGTQYESVTSILSATRGKPWLQDWAAKKAAKKRAAKPAPAPAPEPAPAVESSWSSPAPVSAPSWGSGDENNT